MKLCDENQCTGCGACGDVCPREAISMQPDSKLGHLRPVVDQSKCIECGKCVRSCHLMQKPELAVPKKAYAARLKDDEVHILSSSGGVAAALYEHYIREGYWIAGVAMEERTIPEYILTKDPTKIQEFRKSKYLQPEMNDIFRKVKEKVQAGERVLFIGLPCHCAAVKSVCSDHLAALTIVDIICHGVPSVACMESYINGIQNRLKKNITKLSFRSDFGECLRLYDREQMFYDRHFNEDPFMQAFIGGNLFAESCYRCQYAKPERVGDITIGDFWGRSKITGVDKKMGRISVVILHTEKGIQAFQTISDQFYCEECSIEEAIACNDQLREPSRKGMHREYIQQETQAGKFYECLQELSYEKTESVYKKRIRMDFIKNIAKALGLKKLLKR